jgi:hypothetical protein
MSKQEQGGEEGKKKGKGEEMNVYIFSWFETGY